MIPKLEEYKARWEIASETMIKPGLQAIEQALKILGNPEQKLTVIHVAGTNGKGSTISFMESILKEHGFSTGVFSSPAIIDIHDQIRIDGKSISQVELNKSFSVIKAANISGLLTDFELLTVAAFITFERLSPNYVLVETGMGGLLDSTNVVTPTVSVITSIAVEHENFLGTTISQVAEHKAGIIKHGIQVVTGSLSLEARNIIKRKATEMQSGYKFYGNEKFASEKSFTIKHRKMKGNHQKVNALVAIEALLSAGVQLNKKSVEEAVKNTHIAHRFEEIAPGVIVDGAHNPAAAQALADVIRTEYPGEKVHFIIGMLKGKDIKNTLANLVPVAASFTFLKFPHKDAASVEELLKKCPHNEKYVTTVNNDTILLYRDNETRSIVTGSLYLLSSLKYHFINK